MTSVIDGLSVSGGLVGVAVTSLDKPFVPQTNEGLSAQSAVATPRLFDVLGRTIRYGRGFDDRDDAASAPVVIVDESLARKLTGVADAAGREVFLRRRISRAGVLLRDAEVERVTIAGVLADVPSNRGRDDDVLYLPFAQQFDANVSILARGDSADVTPVTAVLRSAIREADPDVAIGYAGAPTS